MKGFESPKKEEDWAHRIDKAHAVSGTENAAVVARLEEQGQTIRLWINKNRSLLDGPDTSVTRH